MKTTLKFLMFGCMTLALVFTSCSNDNEAKPVAIVANLAIGDFQLLWTIFSGVNKD